MSNDNSYTKNRGLTMHYRLFIGPYFDGKKKKKKCYFLVRSDNIMSVSTWQSHLDYTICILKLYGKN